MGGLQTRRHHVLAVLLVSQLTAGVVLAVMVAAGVDLPSGDAVFWAGGGALAGTAGLAAFYRGLAIGTMSIVAPVSACGAAVPVFYGLATGERPGALQVAGMAVALVGIVLAAREPGEGGGGGNHRASLLLGAAAGAGFGSFFVALDQATETADPFGVIAVARACAIPAIVLVALIVRPAFPGPVAWPVLALVGLLDVGANALFAFATQEGLLSVVSVLGSLYPAVTVVLARIVLAERITRLQELGVAIAITGVVLISAG
jgi:drug/metabolite transporter (DMT)-like permease